MPSPLFSLFLLPPVNIASVPTQQSSNRAFLIHTFLCDTNVIITILVASIQRLAFVLYIDESMLPLVQGLRDTYLVSSVFLLLSCLSAIEKCFFSFLSISLIIFYWHVLLCHHSKRVWCWSKWSVHLHTRSINGKCSQICHTNNISSLTWLYIIQDLPCKSHCLLAQRLSGSAARNLY